MGILERTGVLDRYKVSPTQGTSGLLTGQPALSPFAQQAARNIGGALGMDMRTPQEKVQAELTQVKDPMSPEGLLQRAQIIAANATDAQSLQVAAALATEGRRLKTAQTTKQRAAKGRAGDISFLKENPEYVEYVDDYESFAIGPEFVAKLRQEQVAEAAAERAAGLNRRQRTRTYTALGKLYDVPEETQASIETGELSYLDVEDFKKLYKPENQKGNNVNFEVALDIAQGEAGGTEIRSFLERDDGKLYDSSTRTFKFPRELGVIRKTRAVEKETGEAPEVDTKQAFMAQAQGATLNIARQLGGLSEAEKIAVLGAADTPTRTALLVQANENLGQKAGQVANSTRRIVQAVARELSGAAIKIDEQEDFRQLLVPTLADFGDNDLIFTKLANNYVGFAIANQSGYVRNTRDEAQGEVNASILKDALADLAAQPITPEIQKLVDEGKFEEAVELRKNQLLGGEQGEISIKSLRAKYGY